MRRFIYIFLAFLAYLVFSSRSCVPDSGEIPEEIQVEQIKYKLRTSFGSDKLSKDRLVAYEEMAVDKVQDLADFLSIFLNDSVDLQFREQAKFMIRKLFIHDSVEINAGLISNDNSDPILLRDFLINSQLQNQTRPPFHFDSIRIDDALSFVKSDEYAGSIQFLNIPGDIPYTDPLIFQADISAIKNRKVFGKDTLFVWTVFLGNIE